MDDRISAGELRAMGAKLPDSIPDVATVPRSALRFDHANMTSFIDERGVLRMSVNVQVDAAFEWVEIDAVIKGP